MTIWAAKANFEEHEKGSLEKGKFADFIILDKDIMKTDEKNLLNIKVLQTFLNGKLDLTQAEADSRLAEITTRVTDMVNNGRPEGRMGPGRRGNLGNHSCDQESNA